jgi:predicted transcriptional regulator of viral defense system
MADDDRDAGTDAAARGTGNAAARRKARLAEQLRANLQRRKQQARARRAGDADERQGLGDTDLPDR